MIPSTLVLCDGAKRTSKGSFDSVISIGHRGAPATANIAIQMPRQGLHFDDRATDLIRIAAYVFAADQEVRRGGETDLSGRKWTRDFTLRLPVQSPSFWSERTICNALEALLHFVSDDIWHFDFCQAAPEREEAGMFNIEPGEQLGKPDAVVLFSGGMDSLCAAVEQFTKAGKRPLLLRHAPAPNVKGLQTQLRDAIKAVFAAWHWPIVDCAVHRVGTDPRETTNRTRSFLYAAFGLIIARALKLREVLLCDNGIVSLNLPINDQLVGARASRSTHPRFHALFNAFAALLVPKPITVVNTLWDRTRTETLQVVKDAGCPELVSLTNSCARHRGKTRTQPHCGTCSQCVDRRFATIGAGLDNIDYGEQYEVDIFRDALAEGDARTMAMSYVAFANEVRDLSADAMFERFPQLFDCIPNDRTQSAMAEALVSLVHRQAEQVIRVMSGQIANASEDLARQRLPATSLIVLVAGSEREKRRGADQRGRERGSVFSADYRTAYVGGESIPLTPSQARVVAVMHRQLEAGDVELSQAYILEHAEVKSASLYQLFRGSPALGKLIVPGGGKGMFRLNVSSPKIHG